MDQIPLDFFERVFLYQDVDTIHARKKHYHFPSLANQKKKLEKVTEELAQLKTNDLKFCILPPKLIALSTMCIHQASFEADTSSKPRTLRVGFDYPLHFLSMTEGFVPIQLEIEFTATSELIEIPHSILSYDQIDDGTLAWVVEMF